MNYNYSEFKFPQIKAHPWKGVFRSRTPSEVNKVKYTTPGRQGGCTRGPGFTTILWVLFCLVYSVLGCLLLWRVP